MALSEFLPNTLPFMQGISYNPKLTHQIKQKQVVQNLTFEVKQSSCTY